MSVDAMAGGAMDPIHDTARLQEIAALGLTAAEVDDVLQQTVEEAAARLNLPTAMVSIVMDEAQWFPAHTGLPQWMAEARGTPVEWSFCANAVRSGEPFVVEDAATHPLVKHIPLVQMDNVRCYAGIPLVTSTGQTLGTLCVAGTEPRSFSAMGSGHAARPGQSGHGPHRGAQKEVAPEPGMGHVTTASFPSRSRRHSPHDGPLSRLRERGFVYVRSVAAAGRPRTHGWMPSRRRGGCMDHHGAPDRPPSIHSSAEVITCRRAGATA